MLIYFVKNFAISQLFYFKRYGLKHSFEEVEFCCFVHAKMVVNLLIVRVAIKGRCYAGIFSSKRSCISDTHFRYTELAVVHLIPNE